MQLTYFLSPLALSTFAAAWNLDLYGTDGRHINFHGSTNTGCNTISFTPALNVKRANFNPATSWLPDPDTFELYVNNGCKGLSYRNNGGDYDLTPRVIRSYKVLGSPLKRVRREADVEARNPEFDYEGEVAKREPEPEDEGEGDAVETLVED